MEEKNTEIETPENEVEETTETQAETSEESPKTYSEDEYNKIKEVAENQRIRAEKAERVAKNTQPKEEETAKEAGLSPKDYLALTEAKITSEDFDEVTGWANFKRMSIADAVKDKTLQTILRERAEERKTAEATQVKQTGRKNAAPTPETVVNKASQGNLPDSDEGIEELVRAEIAMKKEKAKR